MSQLEQKAGSGLWCDGLLCVFIILAGYCEGSQIQKIYDVADTPLGVIEVHHTAKVQPSITLRVNPLELLPSGIQWLASPIKEKKRTVAMIGGKNIIHANSPRLCSVLGTALALLNVNSHSDHDSTEIVSRDLQRLPIDESTSDNPADTTTQDSSKEPAKPNAAINSRDNHPAWWELVLFALVMALGGLIGAAIPFVLIFGRAVGMYPFSSHNVKGHATAPIRRGSMTGKEGDQ